MSRRKNPDRIDWAQRTGHLNIAAALERALAKWPGTAARKRPRS